MEPTVSIIGDVFRTEDLPLAAYLRLKGVRHLTMEMVERPEKGRDVAEWVFTLTPRVQNLLDDFKRGDANVDPRRYAAVLRTTRNDMYSFLGYMEGSEEP